VKYQEHYRREENKMYIRQAKESDVSRIAEIYIFNNRVNYYPIFRCDEYSFGELQVLTLAQEYLDDSEMLANTYVYDDGIVRGYIRLRGEEIFQLYVDNFFQSRGIGAKLLEFAVEQFGANWLWALEKNTRAIAFYERHGFCLTDEKVFEEDTTEYLVKMKRQ